MATNGNGAAPVQHEKINTDIVTLTRFLTEEQVKHHEATGDFTYVSGNSYHILLRMLTGF
jgi:fructose-1,6-bisphosphatase I